MFYCPRCKAAVAAEALYCEKCGYNQKTSPIPKRSSGLIRPIGVLPEQPNATAIPTNPMPTLDNFEGYDEGYVATSQAAERWRTSWRKRQRSEAGPATEVSRGQSFVPEPLMSMQQSFARIRAIVTPQQQSHAQHVKRRFWITIVLMLCLIGSLIAFIVWTYLPAAGTIQHTEPPANAPLPSLSMRGRPAASIKQGQMLLELLPRLQD